MRGSGVDLDLRRDNPYSGSETYDFNVCTARKRVEKLRYMHRNPVKRGLVEAPELWRWSGFRVYGVLGRVKLGPWQRVFRMPPPRGRR